jgi:glycerophosphoryl diester phosphodiesterase
MRGFKTRFLDSPRPRNIGHRGAAGHAPENTIESFRRAVEMGAQILELDVRQTKDWVVVVCHDERVDRTTDGSGLIPEMRMSEIAKLDAGARWSPDGRLHPFRDQGLRVPTLAEVLETFPGVPLNIEIKQANPPVVDDVVKLIRRHGAEELVNLTAENPGVMRAIRASGWGGATGYSFDDVRAFVEAMGTDQLEGYEPPGVALQVPERWERIEVVTEAFVHAAHRVGIEVHVWTVNHLADMERLLDLDVDGIVTDFPDVASLAIERFVSEGSRATGL